MRGCEVSFCWVPPGSQTPARTRPGPRPAQPRAVHAADAGHRASARCRRIWALMHRARPHNLAGGGAGERRVLNQAGHVVGHHLKQTELAVSQRPAGSATHRDHPDYLVCSHADGHCRL